jgi:hypothetical protein
VPRPRERSASIKDHAAGKMRPYRVACRKGGGCLEATLDTGDDVDWYFAQVVGEVAGRVLLSRRALLVHGQAWVPCAREGRVLLVEDLLVDGADGRALHRIGDHDEVIPVLVSAVRRLDSSSRHS